MIAADRTLERRVLRRTRLVVAVNLTAAISGVVLLVGGLAFLVTDRQQDANAERYLNVAMNRDTPGVQYSCLWLFTMRDGAVGGMAGAPPGLPVRGSMEAVAAEGRPIEESVTRNGTVYRVRTERRGDEVRQAVFDEWYYRENHQQLLAALMITGLVGLVGAAAVGAGLAHRAIGPLEEALERQRRFVADASHELRAPLTRLHTRTQLILRHAPALPEALSTELNRLTDGTRELREVVDDLLRSARLRSGPPEFERVDLARIATDLIAAEAGRLDELGLCAQVNAAAKHAIVAGVESSLRRMLTALVDNAIGHSHPGGKITLSVAAVEQGRTVEVVVADEGDGLDPAGGRAIFKRFVRGTSEDGQGHGIGLALVLEVVQSHGGTIDATGQPGSGARFTVRLPAAEPAVDGSPTTDTPRSGRGTGRLLGYLPTGR